MNWSLCATTTERHACRYFREEEYARPICGWLAGVNGEPLKNGS